MLGNKIKDLREKHKLTQSELSAKLGIAQSSLGMIESNKRPAGRKTLIKFAEFFNVSIDYLLDDEKANGKIKKFAPEVETIAAHLEGKNITPKKAKLLKNYIDALFDDEF